MIFYLIQSNDCLSNTNFISPDLIIGYVKVKAPIKQQVRLNIVMVLIASLIQKDGGEAPETCWNRGKKK